MISARWASLLLATASTLAAVPASARAATDAAAAAAAKPASREAILAKFREAQDADIIRNPKPVIAALTPLVAQAMSDPSFPLAELVKARQTLAFAHAYDNAMPRSLADLDALVTELAARGPAAEPLYLDSLRRKAIILSATNRYDEAMAIHERVLAAETTAGRPASTLAAGTLNAMGIVRAKQGRYPESLALVRRAVAAYRAAPDAVPTEVGDAWRTLVVLLDLEGLNSEAILEGQKALEWIGANVSRTSDTYTSSINNLASQLADAGRFAEADALFRRYLEIEESQPVVHGQLVAIGLSNLASTLVSRGNAAGAELMLRKARTLLEKEERLQRPDYIAITITSLAQSVLAQGRRAEAMALFLEALADIEKRAGKDHPTAANIRSSIARIHLEEGRLDQAAPLVAASLSTAQSRLDTENTIRLTVEYLDGEVRARRGDPSGYAAARAAILRDRARIVSATLDPIKSSLLARERAENFTRFARLALERGETGDAFEALQVAMLSDLDSSGAEWLARKRGETPALATLMREVQDAARALKTAQAARSAAVTKGDAGAVAKADETIAKLAGEAEQRLTRLSHEFPDYGRIVRPDPVPLATIQAGLAPGEGLLLSVPDRLGTVSMLVEASHVAHGFGNSGTGDLTRLADRLRAGIDDALMSGSASFDGDAAFRLHEAIFAGGIGERAGGVRRLAFQTAGVLSSVPMASLLTSAPRQPVLGPRDFAKAQWLLRSKELYRPVSLAALGAPEAGMRSTRVLAVGAPSVEGSDGSRASAVLPQLAVLRGSVQGEGQSSKLALPPLPNAPKELAEVARALDPSSALVIEGKAATEATLRATPLESFDVVLFATHGLMSGDMRGLTEPALVMTAGNPVSGAAEDGLLTASEISALRLDADWVILSACNTAASSDGDSPMFTGLARAFVSAGARSLLLSQWPLSDDAASRITVDTVKGFARGASKSAALRDAQLAYLSNAAGTPRSHPAFWSSFLAMGR